MLCGRAQAHGPVESPPEVSANTGNISTIGSDNPVVAGLQINSSGVEWSSNSAGTYNVGRGVWLDSGLNSEVWVERTIDSGTLDVDAGSGRLVLSTTRTFEKHDATIPGGAETCTVTYDYYDSAGPSGGNLLDSVQIVHTAEREL